MVVAEAAQHTSVSPRQMWQSPVPRENRTHLVVGGTFDLRKEWVENLVEWVSKPDAEVVRFHGDCQEELERWVRDRFRYTSQHREVSRHVTAVFVGVGPDVLCSRALQNLGHGSRITNTDVIAECDKPCRWLVWSSKDFVHVFPLPEHGERWERSWSDYQPQNNEFNPPLVYDFVHDNQVHRDFE